MSKLIAVDGMTLTFDPPTVQGSISIAGVPSLKSKQDGNGVYLDGLSIVISGVTNPPAGATIPDPVPANGTLDSTATKTKDGGILVLLEGDTTGDITSNPLIPGSPPTPSPVIYKIKIQTAGQVKAKGE
jgi:hypothetical protein